MYIKGPTILLQVSDEYVAGFRPLSGIIKWNVPVYVLKKHIDPGLQKRCDGEDWGEGGWQEDKAKQDVNKLSPFRLIHQTAIDDKLGPIITLSQHSPGT